MEDNREEKVKKLLAVKKTHPNNIAVQVFDKDYYDTLDEKLQVHLLYFFLLASLMIMMFSSLSLSELWKNITMLI